MRERLSFENEIGILRTLPSAHLKEKGPWDPMGDIQKALQAKQWGTALDTAIEVGQALHLSEWFFGTALVTKPKRHVRPW
jgi:hypothetical protein